ncbi:MAG: rRNA maturation RNase YbeY [Alphaproteobacteria bacterium]|nr:rRNA maturation RNase YbeY [Alphaproteobacteria bacterium]
MPAVDVQVRDARYYRLGRPRDFCRRVVAAAWLAGDAEVSVVLAGDGFVRELNRRYRGRDAPTNVLSFENKKPPQGAPWMAGDIVIAYRTTAREARAQGVSFRAHLAHLLVHGALHLQGYDHLSDGQADAMERLEGELMRRMGYADPYGAGRR